MTTHTESRLFFRQPRFHRGAAMGSVLAMLLVVSADCRAQTADSTQTAVSDAAQSRSSASAQLIRLAYAQSAFGSDALTLGAAAFGEAHNADTRTPYLGGGFRVWGSPIDRLTILAEGARREDSGTFAPSVSVQVRALGSRAAGWSVGLLGRYKAEGFAELGGEMEFAALFSYARKRVHLDANTIVGFGLDDDESDGEVLARGDYEVTDFLRVGAEGRVRYRLGGDEKLPGNRDYDALFGPQLLAYYGPAFAAVTAGPSTVGISQSVGWAGIATVGAIAF